MKPSEFTCADVQPHLPLMAGGAAGDDLEPGLVVAVRVHTANCAECAGELQRIESALDSLRAVRDERLVEVELWSGVRAGLVDAGLLESGVLRSDLSGSAPATATPVTPLHAARRSQAWSSGVRLRRWSAAAALALAFGTATFVISGSRSDLGTNPDAPAIAPNAGAKFAVQSPPPAVNHALSAPVNLASDGGGLRRATTEEQRAWRPAQPFSLQAMDGTSSDGAFVARDRHLR